VHSFIVSDLSDNIESCFSSLSQFCYCCKLLSLKDRFDTSCYYIRI